MGSANAEQDQRNEQHGISCDWPTAVSSVWLNREMSPVQPQHLQDRLMVPRSRFMPARLASGDARCSPYLVATSAVD